LFCQLRNNNKSTTNQQQNSILTYNLSFVTPSTAPRPNMIANSRTSLFESDDGAERGVSVDQDGKSNVWAIEPKMEVDTKSSEEKTGGILLGVGALGAFAAVAGVVLTNLPDPNQF
jgi:hypothetical protein